MLLRKLAWSDSDCTSRSVDLKRPLWSFESVTVMVCCTYISSRWKLTRLSRAFEIRSPSMPMRWIIPCRSRLLGRRAVGAREDQVRDRIEIDLDALEQVGDALDEGLEQPGEQRGRRRARGGRTLDVAHEPPDRRGIGVAVGDQPVVARMNVTALLSGAGPSSLVPTVAVM